MATATLKITNDGIRNHATVSQNGRDCTLDDAIEAALQSDETLAADYAAILRAIAPQVSVVIRKEIDGDHDCGCSWYAVELATTDGRYDALTTRLHRLTRTEYRGWHPTKQQERQEAGRILRRACAIGLASAQTGYVGAHTVSEAAKIFGS